MAVACSQCGTPQSPEGAFCGNCGQPMWVGSGGAGPADDSNTELSTLAAAGPVLAAPPAESPSGPAGAPWPDGDSWPGQSTADAASARQDVALGQATPNATYVGQRLLFDKQPESPFDPLSNTRLLLQMGRQYLLYWTIYIIGGVIAGIPVLILTLLGAGTGPFLLWIIGAIVVGIAAACLFWLMPIPALLSEWKFSVDGAAAAGPTTFEHIIWTLRRRQTPLDVLQVRRMSLPGEGQRDYLELRQGLFAGYVACFPYGQDLYVGWTLWVQISPARMLLMLFARIWQSVTQRGSDLFVTLRYDSARAMREAMHSTAREGIDVAVGQLPAQGHGIIGTAVNVAEAIV